MGSFQRAKLMLRRNKKESLAYVATLGISTCLLFLFVNVQKDANFIAQMATCTQEMKDLSYMIAGSLTLIIIGVCFANTFIVNAYYNQAKSEELCVYLSSGMNIIKLTRYLIVQNFILLFFAIGLGFVAGCILHVGLNLLLHMLLSTSGALFTINWQGILLWAVILIIEIIFLALVNAGYAYKAELKDLMKEESSSGLKRISKPKIPVLVSAIFAGLCLIAIVFADATYLSSIAFAGVVFTYSYLHTGIPYRIQQKKEQRKGTSLVAILKQANFMELCQQFDAYAALMMASVVGMAAMATSIEQFPYLQVLTYAAYGLVLIVMAISICIKINETALQRKERFRQLQLMGASQGQLKNSIQQEMLAFFALFISLPVVFGGILCIRLLLLKQMQIGTMLGILGSFIICYSICSIVSWKNYEKQIIKEEYSDELCD